MLNDASKYSKTCKIVNKIAKNIVQFKLYIASNRIPLVIEWCAQVTVAPELNKIIVFNNGTSQGLKGCICSGGQIEPISTVGAKLEWKNAQKNAKKNITSETINKIIP